MQVLRIKDWSTHFENSESRRYRSLTWVPVKNKHDGKGYRRVVKHAKSVQVFCAWNLIVQVASKMPTRGVLLDEDGPLTTSDLSDMTGFPEHIFESAFELLVDAKIAWLEWVEWPQSAGAPADARRCPEGAQQNPAELTRLELNRTEQTRTEEKLHSYEASVENGEAALMQLGFSVLGAKVMEKWGGEWRNRIRSNPGKVKRVLTAMESEQAEGKKFHNPGGYANDLWKRFAS